MPIPTLNFLLGRRSGADVVGLDIQPGLVAAVQAQVNGSILAERAGAVALPAETVRDGEVADAASLTNALRELFSTSGLSKRVRIGVANQRTVLRTLELPALTDRKELASAVTFLAQDQVPMPLNNAVLDFHPLGVIDTPDGPRQRVVLVAAQRDMIERLLAAVREAGLRPEGIDLSAFALIRSLYQAEPDGGGRVLYLNVDGLTNLAIAEGKICRFTRVVGSGLEGLAAEVAARRGITIIEARELLGAVDLTVPAEEPALAPRPEQAPELAAEGNSEDDAPRVEPGYADDLPADELEQYPEPRDKADPDVRMALERGIHDIAGEVRNSLDFHRSQSGGGEVSRIVLSGAALDVPGFAEVLQSHLALEVRSHAVGLADEGLTGPISTHRLAVAAGLATTEIGS
jgi:type IV pilus assembly protein PilM